MKLRYTEHLIYIISLSLLIIFFYFLINHIIKKPLEIINFIDSEIHEDFEIEIAKTLDDINNFLK